MSETALFDRLFIGDGEYVRADTAINTVGALNAEIASLRAQLDAARRKAIKECAAIADRWTSPEQRLHGHGGAGAEILALLHGSEK